MILVVTLRSVAATLSAVVVGLALASCGTSPTASSNGDGDLSIATSFYPIQFATEQIAGDHATVTSLTKPGAEPHDVELSPRDVADLRKVDALIYAKGFQPALDDATSLLDPDKLLNVAPAAQLTLPATPDGHEHSEQEDHEAAPGALDPHFWLDPERYEAVSRVIEARLASDDPTHAADYAANLKAFVTRLDELDEQYRTGLAHCSIHQLITSHSAFGYLAQRYGFTQHGITGLSPDVEPSAAALAALTSLVRKDGITTIYQETLVEPHFAQVVAGETGATIATLDPLEGITSASPGKDYFEVMRANLAALRKGQDCS
jgi:zinc transport system substrate-binding protein